MEKLFGNFVSVAQFCRRKIRIAILICAVWFSACTVSSPINTPTNESPTDTQTLSVNTRTPSSTSTETSTPLISTTEVPTPTITPTPPTLPEVFTSSGLQNGVTPQIYIKDTCKYLKMRWDPNNSLPGTVVMPVMFHSITPDENQLASDGSQIHVSDLKMFVKHALELGFKTITTEQLVAFLETNAKIPQRSLYLILDDRRPGTVRVYFMPYLTKNNWNLTLAWPIGETDTQAATFIPEFPNEHFTNLWDQMETYYRMGHLDVQAHGFIHNITINDSSTEDFLNHEIVDPRAILQDHFYCKDPTTGKPVPGCKTDQPLAFIWPGGGFSKKGAEIARESGYHIGFTINPRGPLMFDWIPLAKEKDPQTPSWLPEVPIGDPLMVLPRYWSKDAAYRLDDVINISKEAINYAEKNKSVELEYYNIVCKGITGEIPSP